MDSIPDISSECTCKGNCSVCVNAVGRSQAVYMDCPDCLIHGKSDVAKRRQREILERITMPDEKDETVDINEKSIQDSIKTHSDEGSGSGIY